MKNIFMSMYLSAANKIAGSARAQTTAAIKREAAKNAKKMTGAWVDAVLPGSAAPRKKRTTRK